MDDAAARVENKQKPNFSGDRAMIERLRAEAKAPYRGIRRFVYFGCAASGLVGGLMFLMQLVAGTQNDSVLSNLGIQGSVLAVAIALLWFDKPRTAR
jgi:hypothetical protein